jgi:hypothetical protein
MIPDLLSVATSGTGASAASPIFAHVRGAPSLSWDLEMAAKKLAVLRWIISNVSSCCPAGSTRTRRP